MRLGPDGLLNFLIALAVALRPATLLPERRSPDRAGAVRREGYGDRAQCMFRLEPTI